MSTNTRRRTESTARPAPRQLATPTDLKPDDVRAVTEAVNPLIADAFALYVRTKNFHWHLAGPRFRDYHLLFDEQAGAILESIDPLAERVDGFQNRAGLFVKQQVVVAESWPRQMPVEILCPHVERERVCDQRIHRLSDGSHVVRLQICGRGELPRCRPRGRFSPSPGVRAHLSTS